MAFIEADLIPRQAVYTLSDQPTLTLTCYDRYGAVLPTPALRITPRPEGIASLEGEILTMNAEGQGALRICGELTAMCVGE